MNNDSIESKDDKGIYPKTNMNDSEREIALEIYRQKYEIFRHFDRLRWQLPSIALPAGGAMLGLAGSKDDWPLWWALLLFGLISILVGKAIFNIRDGIDKNHNVITNIAGQIGDFSIPDRRSFGATRLMAWFMIFLGVASIALSIWRFLVTQIAC